MSRRTLSEADKQAEAIRREAHRLVLKQNRLYVQREFTFAELDEIPYRLKLLEGDVIGDWLVKDGSSRNFVMARGIELSKRDRQRLIKVMRKIVLRRDRMLWRRLERQSKALGLEVFAKENPDPQEAPESIIDKL